MKKLFISTDLQLPMQAVTETFAILAKRGMGKTHTASVLAEEMLEAGAHVVIIDPVGVWFGLRVAADGKKPGFPILIIGGDKADLPLDPGTGTLIADLVIDKKVSVILDLSKLRKGEQAHFMADFAERIYQRNRDPLHLIIDEADAFAPQKPQHGQERMLGAIDDIVRRGRARGLGVTLITQRSAVINKDVLTQAEVLICLRLISPQDRAAVLEVIARAPSYISRETIGERAGKSIRSSQFDAALANLRSLGLIDYGANRTVYATVEVK